MRVLIATDAWHPQVNGVVRTLTSLARSARDLGVTIEFLTPEGFPSVPLPTYPGLRLALPSPVRIAQRIEQASPGRHPYRDRRADRPHGAPLLRRRGLPFTTSYTTRFPEYISARARHPGDLELCGAAPLPCRRHRHHGVDAVADGGAHPARLSTISACGRAASIPICSAPTMRSRSIFRGRSS